MSKKRMLITGGAGFIGSHAVEYFANRGWHISILDDLSRPGSDLNLEYLRRTIPCDFVKGDIRQQPVVTDWLKTAGPVDAVLHMASQVAVTSSVRDPMSDFEVNALGTLNLLEAIRAQAPEAKLIYASTNKVYGPLGRHEVVRRGKRYTFVDLPDGVSESEPLDFHSPYGCSKGAADQYVRDYARVYGLQTVVIRQSCIYGTRQYGVEDQGWVAWFVIAAVLGLPLTIYGDGRQVRDLLWVDDLIEAYERCLERAEPGAAYNVGGGSSNTVSLLELVATLETLLGRPVEYDQGAWRPGDQRVFFSDNRAARDDLAWAPTITVRTGVEQLAAWVGGHREMILRLRDDSNNGPTAAHKG
jgi:CDP-paratose 2-epimerase